MFNCYKWLMSKMFWFCLYSSTCKSISKSLYFWNFLGLRFFFNRNLFFNNFTFRSMSWSVQLHYLGSLTCFRIITDCFPFKSWFCKRSFNFCKYFNMACFFMRKMENFYSNINALCLSPNKINNWINSGLQIVMEVLNS